MPNHSPEHLVFRWIVLRRVIWHLFWRLHRCHFVWNLEKLVDFDLPINPQNQFRWQSHWFSLFLDPKVTQQTHFVAFCTIPNWRTVNKNYPDSPETNFQSDFHDFGIVQKWVRYVTFGSKKLNQWLLRHLKLVLRVYR